MAKKGEKAPEDKKKVVGEIEGIVDDLFEWGGEEDEFSDLRDEISQLITDKEDEEPAKKDAAPEAKKTPEPVKPRVPPEPAKKAPEKKAPEHQRKIIKAGVKKKTPASGKGTKPDTHVKKAAVEKKAPPAPAQPPDPPKAQKHDLSETIDLAELQAREGPLFKKEDIQAMAKKAIEDKAKRAAAVPAPAKIETAEAGDGGRAHKKARKRIARPKRSKFLYVVLFLLVAGGAVYYFNPFGSVEPPPAPERTIAHRVKVPKKATPPPKKAPRTAKTAAVRKPPPPVKPAAKAITPPPAQPAPAPKVTAAVKDKPAIMPPAEKAPVPLAEISAFLTAWKAAWEITAGPEGVIGPYMSFFAEDFKSKGLDRDAWESNKSRINRKKKFIRVGISNIDVKGPLAGGLFEVRFDQAYQSSNYSSNSNQMLLVRKDPTGWKIVGTEPASAVAYPYSIHSGSYKTAKSAAVAIKEFRREGIPAYGVTVDLGAKGIWHRVMVGYFDNPEAAHSYLKSRKFPDARVVKTRYAALIGTFTSREQADARLRVLSGQGLSPYIIADAFGNFRLYVGAFEYRKSADARVAELKTRGIQSEVVER